MANLLLQKESTWYHRFLGSRPLVFLGRISYSVYIWQQIYLTPLNTTFLGKWPLNLVAALATGWLSYRYVELPFIRAKDRFFSPRIKSAATPLATTAVVPSV